MKAKGEDPHEAIHRRSPLGCWGGGEKKDLPFGEGEGHAGGRGGTSSNYEEKSLSSRSSKIEGFGGGIGR